MERNAMGKAAVRLRRKLGCYEDDRGEHDRWKRNKLQRKRRGMGRTIETANEGVYLR